MPVSISRSLRSLAFGAAALVTVGALSACVPYPGYYGQHGGYNGGQHYQQGYNQGGHYRYGYPAQSSGYYYPAQQPGYYQPGYGG